MEATYELVQEQLSEGLRRLKDECGEIAKKQETLIRSDMDQIINSSNFLKSKLQGEDQRSEKWLILRTFLNHYRNINRSAYNKKKTCFSGLVSEPAMTFCTESVSPYLASILEELMGPVSSGFQAVRQRLETELNRICKDFQPGGAKEELTKVWLSRRVEWDAVWKCYFGELRISRSESRIWNLKLCTFPSIR